MSKKKRSKALMLAGALVFGGFMLGTAGTLVSCDSDTGDTLSITITNKDELQEEWEVGGSNRTVSVELTYSDGTVKSAQQAFLDGDYEVISSDTSVVGVAGRGISAEGEGTATVTVKASDALGGATDSVEITVIPVQPLTEWTAISDIFDLASGTSVTTIGQVVALTRSGFWIADTADDYILVYGTTLSSANSELELGDTVVVNASVSAYSGVTQLGSLSSCTLAHEDNTLNVEVDYDTYEPDDLLTAISGTKPVAVSLTLSLAYYSGNYYYFKAPGFNSGIFFYAGYFDENPDADINDTFVTTGFIQGYSTSYASSMQYYMPTRINWYAASMEETTAPEVTGLTITTEDTTIAQGASVTVYYDFDPTHATDENVVVEATSGSDYVTIAQDSYNRWVVTGVAQGQATIRAYISGTEIVSSNTITVTVSDEVYADPTTDTGADLANGQYKLGVYQGTNEYWDFFNGSLTSNGYYLNATQNWESAATLTVEVIDATAGTFTMQTSDGQYIYAYNSGGSYYNVGLTDEAYTWTYTSAHLISTVIDGSTYYIGTYSNYDSFSLSTSQTYAAHLYNEVPTGYEAPTDSGITEDTGIEALATGTYRLGALEDDAYVFFTGVMNSYYYGYSEDWDDGAYVDVVVTNSETGTFTMQINGGTNDDQYLYAYVNINGEYTNYNVGLTDTAYEWTYDAENKAITTVLNNTTYFLCVYNSTMRISQLRYLGGTGTYTVYLYDETPEGYSYEAPVVEEQATGITYTYNTYYNSEDEDFPGLVAGSTYTNKLELNDEVLSALLATTDTRTNEVITSVTNLDYVYTHTTSGWENSGLKFGSSNNAGTITFTTSESYSEIQIEFVAWRNDVATATLNGETYSLVNKDGGTTEKHTFELSEATNTFTLTSSKRFVISQIIFVA